MYLSELSISELYKFLLWLELIAFSFFVPILLLISIFQPDAFVFNEIKFLNILRVDPAGTGILNIFAIFIIGIINLLIVNWFQAAWTIFLARKTPVGQIKIGKYSTQSDAFI